MAQDRRERMEEAKVRTLATRGVLSGGLLGVPLKRDLRRFLLRNL